MIIAEKSILVVEDDADQLEMIEFLFSKKGYHVETATDGIEALLKLRRMSPDLVILDVNLPQMGGIQFYEKICAADGKPRFPVLILSARANIKGFFTEIDVDGFAYKPIGVKELLTAAENAMKKSNRQFRQAFAPRDPRKVLIVEDDDEEIMLMRKAFAGSGYFVEIVKTSQEAIQNLWDFSYDLVLIKLSLEDTPGDILALKLKFFPKINNVPAIVYVGRNFARPRSIIEKFSVKTGILKLVEYLDPADLMVEVDTYFHI